VRDGEGVATRKIDGTSCLIRDGKLFKRREIKKGQTTPPDFELATHDAETGKAMGWVPVGDGPEDARHREAFDRLVARRDGTYELIGPSVQGNPEHAEAHTLAPHAECEILDAPREFEALASWLAGKDIEGLVWHHADGRMAKIKLRDFGLKRGA
jgi:hypothetical protein